MNDEVSRSGAEARKTGDDLDRKLYAGYLSDPSRRLTERSLAQALWQYRRRWSRFLTKDRDAPIVYIGCGAGQFLTFLWEIGFRNLYGVDVSEEQVRLARSLGLERVEQGDALDYLSRFEDFFAVVSAQNVLEHLSTDELLMVLDAAHRALRPGGELWMVVPNALSPLGASVRYADLTHRTCFTPLSLGQALRACGFGELRFFEVRPLVHGIPSAARALLWQGIRLVLHVWRLVEFGEAVPAVYTHDMQVVARRR